MSGRGEEERERRARQTIKQREKFLLQLDDGSDKQEIIKSFLRFFIHNYLDYSVLRLLAYFCGKMMKAECL
jgi:hypothetical protein